MDYYQQKQFLAAVDKDDRLIGKIEKWQAHRKGILHRGFTAILFYQDQVILQQRKHPVFDGCLDLSFSSHPIYKNTILQKERQAVFEALKREWNLKKKDLVSQPKMLGKIYYKAEDPNSKFVEHEVDYIFSVILNKIPKPNLDFAYGFSLVKKDELLNKKFLKEKNFAPWVKKILSSFAAFFHLL